MRCWVRCWDEATSTNCCLCGRGSEEQDYEEWGEEDYWYDDDEEEDYGHDQEDYDDDEDT